MKDECQMRCIRVGQSTIHALVPEAQTIALWSQHLDFPYYGETMQRVCYLGLLRLLKEERRCLEGEEKWRVQARPDHRCAKCGDICQGVYDHRVRVTQLGGQEESNFDIFRLPLHSLPRHENE